METFQSRLSKFIDHLQITPYAFAQEVGTSSARIYQTLHPGKKPQSDLLAMISRRYPELNIEWLVNGHGEMLKERESMSAHLPQKNTKPFMLETKPIYKNRLPVMFTDIQECEQKYFALLNKNNDLLEQNNSLKDELLAMYKKHI